MSTDDQNEMMENLRKLQAQLGAVTDQVGAIQGQAEGGDAAAALQKAQGLLKDVENISAQMQGGSSDEDSSVPHSVKKAMHDDRK